MPDHIRSYVRSAYVVLSSPGTTWKIPCFVPKVDAAEGELMTIKRAAIALGVAPSTIHRLLNDGIIAGEQHPARPGASASPTS